MLNREKNSGIVAQDNEDRSLKVLVSDPVEHTLINGLKERGHEVDFSPNITQEELEKVLPDYEVIVVRSRTKLYEKQLRLATRLRFIARAGIGTDNIDLVTAEEMGIRVVTAAGSSTQSVVELNVAFMVNMARKILKLNSALRNGTYQKESGTEISGKTAGIIGFGRIGFETARVLRALGMNIIAHDIVEKQDLIKSVDGKYVSLNELLETSDYIFLLLTLGKESERVLGKREFRHLKQGSCLINTSRAEAIDPEALYESLETKTLSGYATDVLWHEPPSCELEKNLIAMDNVIVTPHIGAQTIEAQKRVASVTLENLLYAMDGGS